VDYAYKFTEADQKKEFFGDQPIKGTALEIDIRAELPSQSFKERKAALQNMKKQFPYLAKQGVFNLFYLFDKGKVDMTFGDCPMTCGEFLENLCEMQEIEVESYTLPHRPQKAVNSMMNIEKLCRDFLQGECEFQMKLGKDYACVSFLTTGEIEKFWDRMVKFYTGSKPTY